MGIVYNSEINCYNHVTKKKSVIKPKTVKGLTSKDNLIKPKTVKGLTLKHKKFLQSLGYKVLV